MKYGFATTAIHVGQEPEERTGAVTVPLYQTSTYAQEEVGRHKGFEYSRTDNPTRRSWETNIAALENGARGLAFASGSAALDTLLRLFSQGDHIVAAEDMYGGTFRLFETVFRRFGLDFTYVDMRNPENVAAAIKPNTRMVFSESPTNPMMNLTDLAAVAEIAHAHNTLFVVDNTFMTPCLQRPLDLGADIVMHSATKYLGGHSDLVSGLLVTKTDDLGGRLAVLQNSIGAVPGPFDCWLCLRSTKTLAVRMQRHDENARAIAAHLESHPAVQKIYYPGLESHPQHELAKRQMTGFGGMISIDLGSSEKAHAFARSTELFLLAESLGGVESLINYPASMTHGSIPPENRQRLGITDGLIRLSVGIEEKEDLIADLDKALASG